MANREIKRGKPKRYKKPGRPAFKPTPQDRKLVENLSGFGLPTEEIRQFIRTKAGTPIGANTLFGHFRAELDRGLAVAHARVAETLFNEAVGVAKVVVVNPDGSRTVQTERKAPDRTALIYYTKAQMGWRDRTEPTPAIPPDAQEVAREIRDLVRQMEKKTGG